MVPITAHAPAVCIGWFVHPGVMEEPAAVRDDTEYVYRRL